MLRTSVLTLLFVGAVIAANTQSLDQPNLQDLGNQLADNLPQGLPNLPLNASQLPTQEEAEQMLKEKCLKNGGEGAFERAQNAKDEMQSCAQSLVNVTELQTEMDLAKPSGDLDVVFRKYCRKSPQLTQCITNFTAALEPCMEEKEKESKRIVQNITDALLKFVCFKEGDRIALFIAEGGPECLQSQEEQIKTCLNETVGKLVPAEMTSMSTLPMLVLEDKECKSIGELQKCVVNTLEKCSEPTPANIVESLFKFVIKMTPCEKILEASSSTLSSLNSRDSGESSSASTASVALGAMLFLVVGAKIFA